jgi:hypothetical protein
MSSASELCSKHMSVSKNGDIVIDGKVYSTDKALKEHMVELKSQKPGCWMGLTSEKGTEIKIIEHVAAIAREAGIPSVGFLTEPGNH